MIMDSYIWINNKHMNPSLSDALTQNMFKGGGEKEGHSKHNRRTSNVEDLQNYSESSATIGNPRLIPVTLTCTRYE
jgi:hypothetical protein